MRRRVKDNPAPLFICGGGDRGCGFSVHGSRNGRGLTPHDLRHDLLCGLTAARSDTRPVTESQRSGCGTRDRGVTRGDAGGAV